MEGELEIKEIMKLLQPLSVNSKLEIISRLTNDLKADLSNEGEKKAEIIDELYGSWKNMDEKTTIIEELKEAVENIKLVRQGKLKARPAKDLLNESYYKVFPNDRPIRLFKKERIN